MSASIGLKCTKKLTVSKTKAFLLCLSLTREGLSPEICSFEDEMLKTVQYVAAELVAYWWKREKYDLVINTKLFNRDI